MPDQLELLRFHSGVLVSLSPIVFRAHLASRSNRFRFLGEPAESLSKGYVAERSRENFVSCLAWEQANRREFVQIFFLPPL